jgi:hypothetical protein
MQKCENCGRWFKNYRAMRTHFALCNPNKIKMERMATPEKLDHALLPPNKEVVNF